MMFRPLTLALMLALGSAAQAQGFLYRGQLEDGGLPAEGRYDLKLSLFAAPGDKLPLVAPLELSGVEVRDGRFEAPLDFAGLPGGIEQGWLEVAVRAPGDGGWWTLEGRSAVALKAQFCPESWTLSGNASTNPAVNFLGTTDAEPLVLRVANQRVAHYEPAGFIAPSFRTANVIAGSSVNTVAADIRGATIAGGGSNGDTMVAGATGNQVSGHFGTVGGGVSNTAGGLSTTVAGGERNAATGTRASVLGGFSSTASGGSSAVLGGSENCAGGSHSVAAGFRAKVRPGSSAGDAGAGCAGVPAGAGSDGDQGSFVWADVSSLDPFVSSAPNQFLVRANNGMVISGGAVNTAAGSRLRVDGTLRVDALGFDGTEPLCRNASNLIAFCAAPAEKSTRNDPLAAELEDQRIEIAALREELAALRALLEASLSRGGR
jgi:hypothetical protein